MLPTVIYLVIIFSSLSGFLFGYDTGVVSGVILLLKDVFHMSTIQLEVFISITMAMAAIFSFIGGLINNSIGRKKTILLSGIIYAIGSIFLAVSFTPWMLIVGRCILGIAIGISSATVPIYISECVPPDIRGCIVTIYNGSIAFGLLIASIFCGIFSYDLINGWRYMIAMAIIPAFIQIVITFLPKLPESPRYLISIQHTNEARVILTNISLVEVSKEDIEEHIRIITNSCLLDDSSFINICKQILQTSHIKRALFIGCMLQIFQQFIGINTLLYYSGTIIQMSGVENVSRAIWYSVLVNLGNFVFTVIAILLVDKVGRRIIVLISLIGIFLSLIFIGSGFQFSNIYSLVTTRNNYFNSACSNISNCANCLNTPDCGFCYNSSMLNSTCIAKQFESYCIVNETSIWTNNYCPSKFAVVSILGLIVYIFFFAAGMGPIPWTINSEIYPLWCRSFCNSISTFFNWSANLIISMTFLTLTEIITIQGTFYLYASFTMIAFIFMFLLLPETKGRSLEDMEELFTGTILIPCRKNFEYSSIPT